MLDGIERDAGLGEAGAYGLGREPCPMLDAAKAFLFRSDYQLSIAN